MKAWIYYILISVIFITGVSTGIYFNQGERSIKPTTPTTPVTQTTYTYVSLGDSIAEGYGLTGYASKDANGFVNESYANTLKNALARLKVFAFCIEQGVTRLQCLQLA